MTFSSKFERSERKEALHENIGLDLSRPRLHLIDTPGFEDKRSADFDCFWSKILEFLKKNSKGLIIPIFVVSESPKDRLSSEMRRHLTNSRVPYLFFSGCGSGDGPGLESTENREWESIKRLSLYFSGSELIGDEGVEFFETCGWKTLKQISEELRSRDVEGFESLEMKGRCARQGQIGDLLSTFRSFNFVSSRSHRIATDFMLKISEEMTPKLKFVKIVEFNLYDSDITNETVRKLAWNLRERFGELEEFYCNLSQTKVTEKAIIQFFHEMPNLKNFELNIGNCVFTDYGMRIFIRNSLKSMGALEYLNLDFQGTDATSSQITDLVRNIPLSVKKLYLDFRWTRTTSEALKVFMNEKLSMLKDLEEIEIKVDSTLASKGMKQEIDAINRKYPKKIDLQECERYLQVFD